MSLFNQDDFQYMSLAISLAKKGRFTTSPNPNVGCVIVKNEQILGQGFHIQAGDGHAEVNAIKHALSQQHSNQQNSQESSQQNSSQNSIQGATVYVTLEPCSHTGKTPPCALALIKAKVARVVVGMQDPNPQVSGRGIQMLRDAGIQVNTGCLTQACEQLNLGFIKRMTQQRPFVQLKLGCSLDGRTAMQSGESQWITSPKARQDVQQYRAQACAILTGSGTVIADNPSLNVRENELNMRLCDVDYPSHCIRQPLKVIIDNQHQITPEYKIIQQGEPVILVSNQDTNKSANQETHIQTSAQTSTLAQPLKWPEHVTFLTLKKSGQHICLDELLEALAAMQINHIWVEAGAKLAGALMSQNCVDELILYQAPKLLGENSKGLVQIPTLTQLDQAIQWQYKDIRQIGDDLRLVLVPKTTISENK